MTMKLTMRTKIEIPLSRSRFVRTKANQERPPIKSYLERLPPSVTALESRAAAGIPSPLVISMLTTKRVTDAELRNGEIRAGLRSRAGLGDR